MFFSLAREFYFWVQDDIRNDSDKPSTESKCACNWNDTLTSETNRMSMENEKSWLLNGAKFDSQFVVQLQIWTRLDHIDYEFEDFKILLGNRKIKVAR